jgi:hypothetical protein
MRALAALVTLTFLTAACGGGNPERPNSGATPATNGAPAASNRNAYQVFPNADQGADPAVPAEPGGRGFTGEGWETNTD